MEPPTIKYPTDLSLAKSVVQGSLDAWHAFVLGYSALIFSVVRHYLPESDEDARRDAYVRTLEHFYRSGLADYDGCTSLGTWVMTVSRSRRLDVIRNRVGRKRLPAWVRNLTELERFVYLGYFWHGESYSQIAARWADRKPSLTQDVFMDVLDHIESKLTSRARTSMAYELEARSVKGVSRRLLEYMDRIRLDIEVAREAARPDVQLLEEQARLTLERITTSVQALAKDEREVLELHYYQDLPASKIARDLGLSGQRKVYSILERALASLRRLVSEPPSSPPEDGLPVPPSSDRGSTRD